MQLCEKCQIVYSGGYCPLCEARQRINELRGKIEKAKSMKPFLQMEEAAKLINKSIWTLYQWHSKGQYPDFPFIKQGNRVVIDNREGKFRLWAMAHGLPFHSEALQEVSA